MQRPLASAVVSVSLAILLATATTIAMTSSLPAIHGKNAGGLYSASAAAAYEQGITNGKMLFSRYSYIEPRPSTEIYVANADGTGEVRLTNNDYGETGFSLSPDGSKILFSASKDNPDAPFRQSLYIMDVDGTDVRRLTAGAMINDDGPAWSPDGKSIAFSRSVISQDRITTKICVLEIDAGDIGCLAGSGLADRAPSWSPDGSKIAFAAHETTWPGIHAYVMNANGSSAIRLSPPLTDDAYSFFQAKWSPDGKRLAIASNAGLAVVNADGTNLRMLENTKTVSSLDWFPDGERIAFSRYDATGTDSVDIYEIDAGGAGEPRPLIASYDMSEASPQFARVNENVAINHARLEAIVDSAEKTAAELASANAKFVDPLPPEIGNRAVAFVMEDGPDPEIFRINTDGTGRKKLTDNTFSDYNPDWSPDGSKMAFVSNRDTGSGVFQLYVMDADGANVRRLTNDTSYMDMNPAWSPDGTRIAFTRYIATAGPGQPFGRIAVVDADGSNLVMLAGSGGMDASPSWSPDGSRIAFSGFKNIVVNGTFLGSEIYVMNADGTGARQITQPVPGLQSTNNSPSWSPRDDRIVFMSRGGIATVNADGTGFRLLKESEWLYDPFWSPDGSKIVFTGPKDSYSRDSPPLDFGLFVMNPDGTGVQGFLDDGDPAHREGDADIGPLLAADNDDPPQPPDYKDLFCGRPASDYDSIVEGTGGDEVLVGTDGDDLIRGRGGNDTIYGRGGNDCLKGDDGNDAIWGGEGDDVLMGNDGDDTMLGDGGNDVLNGHAGSDRMWGSDGNDTMLGEAEDDLLIGDGGNDTQWGGDGDDRILGEDGDDALHGDNGNDRLYGQLGNDSQFGGSGNDVLVGNGGMDVLIGDEGNDRMWSGAGDDTLYDDDGDDLLNGGAGVNGCFDAVGSNVVINCHRA